MLGQTRLTGSAVELDDAPPRIQEDDALLEAVEEDLERFELDHCVAGAFAFR